MGDHFSLDVDPGQVVAGARRLAALAESLGAAAGPVRTAPDRWAPHWNGASATAIGEQSRALGRELSDFQTTMIGASEAMREYGRRLDLAVEDDLPELNRRWRQALAAHDEAVAVAGRRRDRAVAGLDPDIPGPQRRAELDEITRGHRTVTTAADSTLRSTQAQLEEEFEALRTRLRRWTRDFSDALLEEVVVSVSWVEITAYQLTGGSVWRRLAASVAGLDLMAGVSARARTQTGGPLARLRDQLNHPPNDDAEVTALLERARELGLPADQYAATLEQYWRFRAAEAAGIDLADWDPSKGAEANREIIEAVYRYYGDLYLADPDLQWAGMANMIGPSFAAGFFDLDQFRRLAESVGRLPDWARAGLPPGVEGLAELSADELRFYETAFLSMQREIFYDQGSMHQAYVEGGMEAIRELGDAGLIGPDIVDAWADLDSGDPGRVAAANELFLYREQFDIIDDDYRRMYDHSPTGPAMTWAMTFIGAPSIPGAQGYPDVFPLTVTMETPGPERVGTPDRVLWWDVPSIEVDNPTQGTLTVETPFPDGNIAHFDDRWALIAEDTLPAFQQLLAEDPELARELIAADVGDRIVDYRLDERIDEILMQLGDWEADFDQ